MKQSESAMPVGVDGVRIAMWSGPRNISTALMRAWESRGDTVVIDEPLYAPYLQRTGREHPGREEIIEHHLTEIDQIVACLTGSVPEGKAIFYQKHMAQHLLPEFRGEWLKQLTHGILIRHPREMLLSFGEVVEQPRLEDTGLPQQWDLFRRIVKETGRVPPVFDARDVLLRPREMLQVMCDAFEVPFREAMLTWKAGPRSTDGIWAKFWYKSVQESTEFRPYRARGEDLADDLLDLEKQCLDYYSRLYDHRLTPAPQ